MILCLCLAATLGFSACDVDDDDNEDGKPDNKIEQTN